jgi:hypothetical protein
MVRKPDCSRTPLRAFHTIHGGTDHKADLVDEAGSKESANRGAAALDQQALDREPPIQDLHDQPQVEVLLAGEHVGHANPRSTSYAAASAYSSWRVGCPEGRKAPMD